jgi:hypothetical protein
MSAMRLYGVPDKMTRRLLGVVIGTQSLAVFFAALAARAVASAEGSKTAGSFLLMGALLGVLCILDAGLLRRPWGVTAGWVLQLATLAFAFVIPLMLPVGLLFAALWLTALVQGRNMDEHTRRVDAQWHATHPASAPETTPETSEPETSEPETSEPETSEPGTTTPETTSQGG